MRKTGVVWEKIYTEHVMGVFHPESPNRLMAVKDVLDNTDIGRKTTRIDARPATKDELARVHDEEYIKDIEATRGKTVYLDPDTTACPKTWDAALMSAGGAIEATEAVLSNKVDNAFAFTRPPGHHAERGRAMGFCIFNNIAVAAEYAIKKHGLKRIAVIDFDVHHGNGTQHAFYHRSDVFYISTHLWPFYPGTGSRDEHGEGKGKGYTLNVPFSAGAGDMEFKKVYNDVVVPVVGEYNPELILVSAGYDAHERDSMAYLNVSTAAFNWLTGRLLEAADTCCGGRIVFVLEGGYDLGALKECVEGALRVLSGPQ